ncbi:MAG: YdcF family protein [Alphaproteobacteria bacterium]|nr:YdcF family protein [Alphaproteobacteria bacterium]
MERRRLIFAVCLLIPTVWIFGFLWFIDAVKQSHIKNGDTVDAIVVLTGGSLRLDAGLALLAAKKAPKLFVSGVYDGISVQQLLRLSRSQPDALDCCITLGYAATDTHGNAAETALWMRAQGHKSLLLVTANYHMPRSLLEFQHALPRIDISTHPVSPPHVPLEKWWSNPGTGLLLLGEYNKYLLASARLLISSAFGSNRVTKDS